jgi:hypothetical protein
MGTLTRFAILSTPSGKLALPLIWIRDLLTGQVPRPLPKGYAHLGGCIPHLGEHFTVVGSSAPRSSATKKDFLLFRYPNTASPSETLVSLALEIEKLECIVATDRFTAESVELSSGKVPLLSPPSWLKPDEWAAVVTLSARSLKAA